VYLLQKKDKENIKVSDYLPQEEIDREMDELLKHYGADRSQANIDKTKKILGKFKSVNDELVGLREENR
jgi:hypothetical protein